MIIVIHNKDPYNTSTVTLALEGFLIIIKRILVMDRMTIAYL